MSPLDVPGAFVLIALGFLVWAIHVRRAIVRRREQKARAYWIARQAARTTPRITVNDYHHDCLTGRHGPECKAEAERIDAVLAELEKEWHGGVA